MRALERAWRGGRNEWRMHVVTALSSSVAFLCLAFALLMVVNLQQLQQRWQSVGRLSAFLRPEASSGETERIVGALRNTPGIKEAVYISSKGARGQLMAFAATDVLQALPIEAFPASLELTLEASTSEARARQIADRVSRLNIVESVETYGAWSERVSR